MGDRIGLSFRNRLPLDKFQSRLETALKLPLDCIEISPELGPVLIGGRLNPHIMREIKTIIKDFPFAYTVHCPEMENLRDMNNIDMQQNIFKAGLEFTKEIGGSIYVTHFSKKSTEQRVETAYRDSIAKMADYAYALGVMICVENIEIELAETVVELIQSVNHESVQMTYDFGHSFLASTHFGYDFLDSVKMAKPYIKHMHIHDNYGLYDPDRLRDNQKALRHRLTIGRGDLHLPLGWGQIPYNEVFKVLKDTYTGIYMLEYDVGLIERCIEDTVDLLKTLIAPEVAGNEKM